MTPEFAAACGEFLQYYRHDAALRWSPGEIAAQQQFVAANLPGEHWLDWSTAEAALQLLQAAVLSTALGVDEEHHAVLLAGPVVELLEPAVLFQFAVRQLKPGGHLVGIIPCLRDNSPENQAFINLAASVCWPYATAEEILEAAGELGFSPQPTSAFVAVPSFNDAVTKDQLGFKGYRRIFDQLAAQGYDPMAVGWGELRMVAITP